MAELAVGHVSIVADTSKLPGQIKKSLGGASGYGSDVGSSIGSKISSGIGKTLKAGVAGVGVAAGGALAGSITKGLGRLTGIETAQAKLKGLGNDAEDVESIMDNALASVKGTSFGLGEAATTAAGAVAAGIKPGKELEGVLKSVANSASATGSDMDEMGGIFNKVASIGKAQNDVLSQVADRGLPIYQALADQLGVTTDEVFKMASAGEIGFAEFEAAMTQAAGTVAEELGGTTVGTLQNVGSAMGRFGESLLAPAFSAAPALFGSVITVFDELTDAVKPVSEEMGEKLTPALEGFADIIETRVAPFAGEAVGKLGDIVLALTDKALDPGTWEKFGDIFTTIKDVVTEMWPSIESLAGSFLTITQNISVATWQILASTLEAIAPLIESVLVPLVEKVAEFAENNPGVVEKMVMAFLGFKAMGAIAGPVGSAASMLGTLGGAVKGVSGAFKGASLGQGLLNLMGGAKSANPILAKLGGVVGTVFKAFWKVMPVLSKVAGIFMKAIRFINPWVGALTLVAGALTYFFTQTELGQEIWQGLVDAVTGALDWIKEKFEAFTGWISDAWDGLKSLFLEGDFTGALRDAFGWEEDNAFVNGILTVRDVLTGIPDLITGITDILFKGDFSGMPFGLEEDSGFVNFLFNVRDAVIEAGDFIKKVFDGIWQAAQITLGVIGTVILTPFILAWQALSWGIKAAWENIIKPVWDALSSAVTWVWENVISPTFTWIGEKWQALSDTFSLVWEIIKTTVLDAWSNYWGEVQANFGIVMGALNTAWTWLKDTFTTVWTIIKTTVLDVWNAYWSQVQANFAIVTGALNTAWTWIKDQFTAVWNVIKSVVVAAFEQAWTNLKNNFQTVVNLLNAAWTWLKDQLYATWSWIDQNVLGGFRRGMDAFKSFFEGVVDGIKGVWNTLRSALAKPINFMINTVYNGGILKAWETIRKFLPGLKEASPLASIPEHATGGRISGPGTGTSDDVLMWGSNGEHMLTAREVQRLGGHNHVYAMRKMVESGRPFSFDGRGGIVGLPRRVDNRAGDLAGAAPDLLIPKFAKGGEIRPLWEAQLERGHAWAQSRSGRPYVLGGSAEGSGGTDCSGFMSGIASVIQGGNGARQWATMAFNGGGNSQYPSGPQGFVAGLKANTLSIGVTNGGTYGGHTAGTLGAVGKYGTVNVESGGAPSMVKYGAGAAGADDPYFRTHYHLPIGPDGAFVSGGGGGISPEAMQDGLKKKVSDLIDKAMDPILSKLPVGPPEWQNIPKGVYDKGKKGMLDTAFDMVGKLGDKLASVWTAAGEVKDLITGTVSDAASWVNDRVRSIVVRDHGGIVPHGAAAVNTSGKDELMLPPSATQAFLRSVPIWHELVGAWKGIDFGYAATSDVVGEKNALKLLNQVESIGTVVKEIKVAYEGGDWGYGELARYIGEENAKALVDEAWWLGSAVGEMKLALKGQDGGFSAMERYFGKTRAVEILNGIESASAVMGELRLAFEGSDGGYAELSRYMGDNMAKSIVDGTAVIGNLWRNGIGTWRLDPELEEQARKSAEDYAAEQASGLLSTFGLEGLVPLAQKLGADAWEAYQASPYDVGVNGQTIVVEYVGDENDREWKMLQKLDKEVALLKAKRKPKASAMTRGGVQ